MQIQDALRVSRVQDPRQICWFIEAFMALKFMPIDSESEKINYV